MNCKSASVMTGHISFLLQPKLIWLVILFSIYWLYWTSIPQDLKRGNSKFFDIFVTMVLFEILSYSHYPIIDSYIVLEVQWIIDKVLLRETIGLNGFDTFFYHFSNEILVFACFCCCFYSQKTYGDFYLIKYA